MTNAIDVITEALAVALPSATTEQQDIARRARLVHQALIEHGHLPDPTPRPVTEADYVEAAKWLAERSLHARYAGEGWTRILESGPDVEVAATAALRACGSQETERMIQEARALLLARVAPAGAR